MAFQRACIPLGFAWSSPFAKWQGPLAEISALDLAVDVTGRALEQRGLPASEVSSIVLGWTVPQQGIFYGAPTVAARLGAPGITGPMISQACATGVATLDAAARDVETGGEGVTLVVTTDRTSNGPVLLHPTPSGMGGAPAVENWVLDNFARDPWAGEPMWRTAEAVAAESQITRDELDDVTLMRYEQYGSSLEDERAFQRRYMVPVEIPRKRGEPEVVDADVGIFATTAEGLAKLAPVDPEGVITFGSQTHPADGCAGMIVTTAERARELGGGEGLARILGTGFARAAKARMPTAPVPAAQAALAEAGVDLADINAVTTHNPFTVNDVYFARETGYPVEQMNAYGCSLVFGHPQAPTGTRALAELIETLRLRGGGLGLFTGCAAGDTGAAVVLRVDDA
jgi:acetyl-CoA acetyltransferase family protein